MRETSAPVVLVARADDAGAFRGTAAAIEEASRAGVVQNSSIIAVAAHFEDAARVMRGLPDLCVGLHVTLTSEWRSSRWRPISPAASARSLVATDGGFFASPLELFEHGVDLDEAMAEARAQLDRARRARITVSYVDEHMGVGWVHAPGRELPRLRNLLSQWARSEGLVWHEDGTEELPTAVLALRDDVAAFAAAIAALPAGRYCWVTHPARDDDELRRAFTASGEHAADRVHDLACVTSPMLRQALNDAGVRVARYDELAPETGG